MIDVGFMHTIDLGVLLYLHGGAMWLMCRTSGYIKRPTQELRCKELWRMIKKHYKDRLHDAPHIASLYSYTPHSLSGQIVFAVSPGPKY